MSIEIFFGEYGIFIDFFAKVCYNKGVKSKWEFKMARRLFLLLFSGLIGIIGNPEILMASDSFEAMAPDFNAVETVILPEEKKEEEPVYTPRPTQVVYQAPVVNNQTNVAPVIKNYTVTIFTDKMIAKNLSYSDIYKYRKLVYGHNTSNLLGNLKELSIGDVFTITENGVVKNYRVSDKKRYEKTADGYLEGDSKLMGRIASAMGHNIALMTCDGESRGGGDAQYRLVIYADAI